MYGVCVGLFVYIHAYVRTYRLPNLHTGSVAMGFILAVDQAVVRLTMDWQRTGVAVVHILAPGVDLREESISRCLTMILLLVLPSINRLTNDTSMLKLPRLLYIVSSALDPFGSKPN